MTTKLVLLLGTTAVLLQGIASGAHAADPFKTQRDAFIAAYNKKQDATKYKELCAVLHPDATFRGSLLPDHWSHKADGVVRERWNKHHEADGCDCGANVGKCEPFDPDPGPHPAGAPAPEPLRSGPSAFSIGTADITMQPDTSTGSIQAGSFLVDTGTFTMAPKLGINSKAITNPYVILWGNNAATGQPDWKMMVIDMHPCGTQQEACK